MERHTYVLEAISPQYAGCYYKGSVKEVCENATSFEPRQQATLEFGRFATQQPTHMRPSRCWIHYAVLGQARRELILSRDVRSSKE